MSTSLQIKMDVPIQEADEIDFDSALPTTTGKALKVLSMAISEMEKYIDAHTNTTFDRLMAERQATIMLDTTLEALRAERDNLIGSAMDIKGVKRIAWENYIATRREGSKPRMSLDRKLLMTAVDTAKCPSCMFEFEIHVTPFQVAQATKVGKPGKPGLTVKSVDFSKDDDEE
jgi:hypothetical protein